ncbi:Cupredoxin [Xylariaceae sp. FL0804]|nr:Cupredoxin [Xylariaceae sp. FL0804]
MWLFCALWVLEVASLLGVSCASPLKSTGVARRDSCEHTPTSRDCWGNYSIDTDYYLETPDTGVTREYWLSAESTTLAPDGYERTVLVMNGSLPGPTIEADWGDELVIHVTNNMVENGTAIHWHGIRQLDTNPSDGVPGITQCPTAPGETTTYRFRATQYGTSWYHSHFSLQLADGLIGPIVIHGPSTADYDVDVGPVLIQDWFHASAFQTWEETQRVLALLQPQAENGLINGLNPYDCADSDDASCVGTDQRFETTFEQGKKYLLRVVGVQVDGYMKFTIDGHKLQVIASDFVPIQPYETDAVILASGQRYDVVVEADQDVGAYWMRAIYQTACNSNDNDNKDNILGIVRYEGADNDTALTPNTTVAESITNSCGDEPYESLVPWVSHEVGSSATRQWVNVQWYYELDLVFHWTLRSKTLTVDWADPTLLDIYHNTTDFPATSNVATVGDADTDDEWVYWIVQDLTLVDAFHPMHLHGHDFYVLAQGEGLFVPGLVTLNTQNPPRRDTVSLYGDGYTVIAFKTDNPGSWLFHCHIAWHASQGLALQLVERTAEIPATMDGLVEDMTDTCSVWADWYETSTHEQDDSGI